MSIWKSPVFYFGILLFAAVSFALAAPYVVDWNRYKADLETYGQKLTGRDVKIAGKVAIRLFPVPSLTAEQVTIANPGGVDAAPFMEAERLHFQVSLGSLMNGSLNVQTVEVTKPRFTLVRDKSGQVNWFLGPDRGLALAPLLSGVRLDSIAITDGSLRIEDREKNVSLNVNDVDAQISAVALEGPWRLKGSAQWRDIPMSITFTSSPYTGQDAFRFGLKLAPIDPSLPAVSLDGGLKQTGFEGALHVDPQDAVGAKGSAEGGFKPLALDAKFTATRDRADLEDIKIAPIDPLDSGTLIEGRASLVYDDAVNALVELNAPRINLDSVLGAESLAAWRAGGLPAMAQAFMREMPDALKAEFLLDAGVVTVGGETLPKVVLKARAEQGLIRISEGRAGLPGRTNMLFTGDIKRRDGAAELVGKLDLDTLDLRQLTRWLAPEHQTKIDAHWTGSRGQFKLVSNVMWRDSEMRLDQAQFQLDQQQGSGDVTFLWGALPALKLKLDVAALDIDQLLPGGSVKSADRAFDVLGWFAPVLNRSSEFDTQVAFKAGSLTYNGVVARSVAFDVTSSLSGFEIKQLEVGSVGGAAVSAQGTVLNLAEGPSGDIRASVKADDPNGLLQLMGFTDATTKWTSTLGNSDLTLSMKVSGTKDAPVVELLVKGKSGAHLIDTSGALSDLNKGRNARVALNGKITATDAKATLALLGIVAKADPAGAGLLDFNFTGSRDVGFASRIDTDIAGMRVTFDGSMKPGEAYAAMAGTVNVVAPDASQIFKLFGVPMPPRSGALQLSIRLSTADRQLKGEQLFGALAGTSFKGNFAFDAAGMLTGQFETGEVTLAELSSLALLPWDGTEGSLQDSFAQPGDGLFHGAVSILPAKLKLPFAEAIPEAVVTLEVGDTRRVSVIAPTRPDIGFSILVVPKDGNLDVTIEGASTIQLADVVKKPDGAPLLSGKARLNGTFKGKGRSPASVLASLAGSGSYGLEESAFTQLNPAALNAATNTTTTAADLETALKQLELGGGLAPGTRIGTFEFANGALSTAPIIITTDVVTTEIKVSSDLAATSLKVESAVKLNAKPDLPSAVITYEGLPGEMDRRSSTSDLAAKLGHDILARDLAALEKIKTEQERLLAVEEAQRADDVQKFEAYQALRAELRLRVRELKIHGDERQRIAVLQRAELEEKLSSMDALNKRDLAKAKLQLAVFKKMNVPIPVPTPVVLPPSPVVEEPISIPETPIVPVVPEVPKVEVAPIVPVVPVAPVVPEVEKKPPEKPKGRKKRAVVGKIDKPKETPVAPLAPTDPAAIPPAIDPELRKTLEKLLAKPKPGTVCEGLYC